MKYCNTTIYTILQTEMTKILVYSYLFDIAVVEEPSLYSYFLLLLLVDALDYSDDHTERWPCTGSWTDSFSITMTTTNIITSTNTTITIIPTTTSTTTTTTTTTLPSQGSNAGLDYIGWFTCSLDGGGPNYKAGVDFNMVSGGVGYVQIEYSLNGGGWTSLESNYEISSGFSVTKTAIFSDGSSVQFRYRVSKYNGVHNGVNWSNTFISGQGEVSSPIELNSSNCN